VDHDHHAVVWLDHSEAKIFRFASDEEAEVQVHSHTSLQRLHHRAGGWEAGGNPPDDTEFFERIAGALDHTGGTVITGPGNAKSALKEFLDRARPHLASRVFAVEGADAHPGTHALLALGRRYFGAVPTPPAVKRSLRG
jgi:stalled ribosome rescue protein Dom34